MAVMTFAAIDIGSYEVSMKIFEMSKRIGFRELNDVRYSLEIGKGVYSDGKIDSEMLNVLCEVLNDFKRLMQDFGVEEYRACGTSAFRELVNPLLIIEQIYQRTGMKIEILSSAEQHFLGYKSIAAIEKGFKKMIQKGTAILDVGGGSLQVSLFDKDALVTTQGLKMGSLRIRQRLQELEKTTIHYDKLIEEIKKNREAGMTHQVVINAEGVGHSYELAQRIEEATGVETRATILGHLQRGGSPTARDRVYASVMGSYAVDIIDQGKKNRLVGYKDGHVYDIDIEEAFKLKKSIDDYEYQVASILGTRCDYKNI